MSEAGQETATTYTYKWMDGRAGGKKRIEVAHCKFVDSENTKNIQMYVCLCLCACAFVLPSSSSSHCLPSHLFAMFCSKGWDVIVAENIKKRRATWQSLFTHKEKKNTPTTPRVTRTIHRLFLLLLTLSLFQMNSCSYCKCRAKWTIFNQPNICMYNTIHVDVDECCVFISTSSSPSPSPSYHSDFFFYFYSVLYFFSCVLGGNFLVLTLLLSPSQQCVHFIYSLIYICLHPFYFEY